MKHHTRTRTGPLRRPGFPTKTPEQLRIMRAAGRVVAEMHAEIRAALRPGVTTADLDRIARDVLARRDATSNFLGYGYPPFPAVICASVNEQVIHGVPGPRRLEAGDIISIDCGAVVDGWHGDAAFTAGVGAIAPEAARLIDVADAALAAAIDEVREGRHLSDVGHAVEQVTRDAGLGLLQHYTGHGIGRAMHEAPEVPNHGRPGRGTVLEVGNVLAIEPMLTLGGDEVAVLDDHWTVVTADGSLGAHVEHTVAVTEDGPEILTRL
jgi:methionyl aminopeptidase